MSTIVRNRCPARTARWCGANPASLGLFPPYGEVIVEDSDFTIEHGARLATSRGGTITERGNRTGAQASTEPPPGVPTSAEDIYAMLE